MVIKASSAPDSDPRAFRVALALALTIALAHIAATWGHTELFWGDSGRWLHEVERFANGETVYRDFMWLFPPLAMWLLGGITRIVGPDLRVILGVMSVVYLLVVVAWVVLAERIVPSRLLPLTVLAGLLMATAVAMIQSAPLPVGMYVPAAPIGGLMLLAALLAGLRVRASGGVTAAALLGVFAAACVLAKQDYWAPAGVLGIGVSGHVLLDPSFAGRRAKLVAAMYGVGAVTLLVGVLVLVGQNDSSIVWRVTTGFGAAGLGGARALPGLGQLVLHLGVLASIVALVSLLALLTNENRSRATFVTFAIASVIALVTMSLWLFQAVKIGREVNTLGVVTGLLSPLQSAMRVDQPPVTGVLLARAVFTLRERLFLIPLPLLLPVALLAMSLTKRSTWRRDGEARGGLLLLMLSVCVAARLRRGFEHTEWFHVLLEVPTAILFASLAWQHWRDGGLKTQRALLATVAVVGVLAYWHLGTGTLTRRGRGVVTKSARGDVWLGRNQSLDLGALRAVLDSIDPSGTRQLMSAGFTAGFNYHLGRRSASPFTTGFSYSNGWDTDSVIDVVIARRPSTLIIDHPFYVDEVPVRHWSLRQWDRPMELNHHVRLDRPRFDRLLQLCRGGRPAGTGEVKVNDFVVIDCSLTTE